MILTDQEVYQALKRYGYAVHSTLGGSIDIDTPRACLLNRQEARALLLLTQEHGKITNLDDYGEQRGLNTWFDFSTYKEPTA